MRIRRARPESEGRGSQTPDPGLLSLGSASAVVHFPRRIARDGVVLVLALVMALVLATSIFLFHQMAMQSKVEVSRALLGDAAQYLAESMVEESFIRLAELANRGDSPWFERFRDALPGDREKRHPIEGLTAPDVSGLAGEFGAQTSALARIVVLYQRDDGDPREKLGSLEVEARVAIPLPRGQPIVRRVLERRDFKGFFLTGQNPLSDYALFVKDVSKMGPVPPAQVLPAEPALIVKNRRDPSDSRDDSGAVYLGTGRGTRATEPVQLIYPGREKLIAEEIGYLQGVPLVMSASNPNRYEMGGWHENDEKFLDENVPREKAAAIIADMLGRLRGADGQPFTPEQIEGVTSRVEGLEMTHEFLPADGRSAGLDIYVNDPGKGVEGNLYYPYWFRRSMKFRFSGSAPPSDPATHSPIVVSAVSFLNANPSGHDQVMAPLDHVDAFAALPPADKRSRAQGAVSFMNPRFYARLFSATAEQPDPQKIFEAYHLSSTPGGTQVLRIDGISGIIGDLKLEGDFVVQGQGVLVVLGRIEVTGAITKRRATDQLFLVSRGSTLSLPGGRRVEAAVQALHLRYPDQRCTLEISGGAPMDLLGSLAIDELQNRHLETTMNLVQYDRTLSFWIFHTSVAERASMWTMLAADDPSAKELIN